MIKKMIAFVKKQKGKFAAALIPAVCLSNTVVAFAADKGDKAVKEITDGIDLLKKIVLSSVAGVGIIFLAMGVIDFASAYSAHDTTQQTMAIKKVIGGIITIATPAIIAVFA